MDKKYNYIVKLSGLDGFEFEIEDGPYDSYDEAKEETEGFKEPLYSVVWYYGDFEEYYETGEYEYHYDSLEDGDFFDSYDYALQYAKDRVDDGCVSYDVIEVKIVSREIVEVE